MIVKDIDIIFKNLQKINVCQQNVLFSATYNDLVVDRIKNQIGDTQMFPIKKESLKLKGVKNYKVMMDYQAKLDFTIQLYTQLDQCMTMIFVNSKADCYKL